MRCWLSPTKIAELIIWLSLALTFLHCSSAKKEKYSQFGFSVQAEPFIYAMSAISFCSLGNVSKYQLTSWLNLIGNLSKQIGRFTGFSHRISPFFLSRIFTTICAGEKSRKSELLLQIAENILNARSPDDSYALNHFVIFVCQFCFSEQMVICS